VVQAVAGPDDVDDRVRAPRLVQMGSFDRQPVDLGLGLDQATKDPERPLAHGGVEVAGLHDAFDLLEAAVRLAPTDPDIDLAADQCVALDASRAQRPIFQRKGTQHSLQPGHGKAETDQRAEDHVPGGPGAGIDEQQAHQSRSTPAAAASAGTISPAGPARRSSTCEDSGVGSGLISTTNAPEDWATWGSAAAG